MKIQKFVSAAGRFKATIAFVFFSIAPQALAAAPPTIVIGPSFVTTSFCSIVSWMFFILSALCTIMILWGAFLYLTAGDDTEKVHTATKTITYAAIGILVALLAKALPQTIANIFRLSGSVSVC